MYTSYFLSAMAALSILLSACGGGKVNVTDATYQPRIVIQGVLSPGQLVQVAVRRNYSLSTPDIDPDAIPIPDAGVIITDAAGTGYTLTFNAQTGFYESQQLAVDYGQTYTLAVSATINGQALQAGATTTVPAAGFRILESESILGSRPYRQRDDQGNLIDFTVAFDRSPDTGYYAISLVSLDADTSTFIYNSPFNEHAPEDVLADFEEFKYNYFWLQDRPLSAGVSRTEIASLYTFFYGKYRVIVYAADRNFRDFQTTHEVTQGVDGNFHEPAFHIDGDGIGVFGSAVVDTTYFEVLRP